MDVDPLAAQPPAFMSGQAAEAALAQVPSGAQNVPIAATIKLSMMQQDQTQADQANAIAFSNSAGQIVTSPAMERAGLDAISRLAAEVLAKPAPAVAPLRANTIPSKNDQREEKSDDGLTAGLWGASRRRTLLF